MKWIKLTKASGDSGYTSFGANGKRILKSEKVLHFIGNIDGLNGHIGISGDIDIAENTKSELQALNREVMGYLHTNGMYKQYDFKAKLNKVDEALKVVCTKLDEIDENGAQGWYDYDNQWFVACDTCRGVERLLVELIDDEKRNPSHEFLGDLDQRKSIMAIYNRMSKLLYTCGVYYSMTVVKVDG